MPRLADHDKRREEVAEAVWTIIGRVGVEKATLREIAREANCSTGMLSHYFRDKDELVRFAFGLAVDRAMRRIRERAGNKSGLEVLRDVYNPISLITRSPLIVRDVDVLGEAASRADVSVNFSIPTLALDVWRRTEPGTAPPRQRLRALKVLRDAGIRAGVGMAPLLPGLSDKPEQIAEVIKGARDSGASYLWANVLYLRPGTREHFLAHLARDWPEQLPLYQQLYDRRAYLDKADTEPTLKRVAELRREYGVGDRHQGRPAALERPPAAVTAAR